MSNFPLVYVLILNWKSAQDTIECVESVQKSDYSNNKILLIDNASPDDSEKILRARFPDLEFIQTGKNLGYAGGNNIGIHAAVRDGAEFVWILNPDVRVAPLSLSRMIKHCCADLSIGICGPLLDDNGTLLSGASISYEKGFSIAHNLYLPGDKQKDVALIDVDYVIGCSMLIRTKLLKEIGLFRENFFLYGEETEICLRAKKAGWRNVVCADTSDAHRWFREKKTNLDKNLRIRNCVLLARIQKKGILKTICYSLGFKELRELRIKAAFKKAFANMIPVFFGLLIRPGKVQKC